MTSAFRRKVTANLAITLDGRFSGPGGAMDMSAIVPYATTETARNHLGRIHESASLAVLGRVNAEGFLGYWPTVAADAKADPRDRRFAQWLSDTQKVVFSSTLTSAPWERTQLENRPAKDVIAELRTTGEGEILVNSSASVIKPLLAVDMIDRLYLLVTPEIAGGGKRLFDDGLPATSWTLTRSDVGERGEMALIYDRVR